MASAYYKHLALLIANEVHKGVVINALNSKSTKLEQHRHTAEFKSLSWLSQDQQRSTQCSCQPIHLPTSSHLVVYTVPTVGSTHHTYANVITLHTLT